MTPRFKTFMPFIIEHEGSIYENDPDDAGGATKYGIDQRSHPNVSIKNLTLAQASEIYWKDYWTKIRADEFPAKVGEVMMDISVNNGLYRAATWLQRIVGTTADGHLGPLTFAAVAKMESSSIANALILRRSSFYKSIAHGSQAKYLNGWINRNNDLLKWIHEY